MVVMNTRSGTQVPKLYLRCMVKALQRALRYSYWVIIYFVCVPTPAISSLPKRWYGSGKGGEFAPVVRNDLTQERRATVNQRFLLNKTYLGYSGVP